MDTKKRVTLYTDGACSGNPGLGGYGGILIYGEIQREYNGSELQTTNNRMELMAVIVGLKRLKYPCFVDIYSDSAYTVNAFLNGWIYAWKKKGYKKADGKAVSNDTKIGNGSIDLEINGGIGDIDIYFKNKEG